MFDFETTPPWIYGLAALAILACLTPFALELVRRRLAERANRDILERRQREVEQWHAIQASRKPDSDAEPPVS